MLETAGFSLRTLCARSITVLSGKMRGSLRRKIASTPTPDSPDAVVAHHAERARFVCLVRNAIEAKRLEAPICHGRASRIGRRSYARQANGGMMYAETSDHRDKVLGIPGCSVRLKRKILREQLRERIELVALDETEPATNHLRRGGTDSSGCRVVVLCQPGLREQQCRDAQGESESMHVVLLAAP